MPYLGCAASVHIVPFHPSAKLQDISFPSIPTSHINVCCLAVLVKL